MGACKTQGVNTGQRYYFNEISDVMNGTEMGGDNINKAAAMEQRVSLICCLKNIGNSGQYKIELIMYSDPERKASKSAGFTETKQANETNNISDFQQSNNINTFKFSNTNSTFCFFSTIIFLNMFILVFIHFYN